MSALGPQFDDLESLAKNSSLAQSGRMRRDGEMDPESHAQYGAAMKRAKQCPRCTYLATGKRDLEKHTSRNHS